MAKKQSSMQQQGCCLIPNFKKMKGIHRTPSLPADGQLDYLVNLIPHDGELRPIPATEQLADTLQEGDVLLCVHHTNADVPGHRRHLIVKTTGGSSHVLACYDADGHRSVIATLSTTINAVQPAGNVLVISCGDEASRQTMYAVFSPRHDTAATESGYAFVGAAFPSLDLQFQLRNTFVQTFAKGEDTGIVLEENAAAKTVDFTQTVPLSPQQVELFRGEHTEILTLQQPLQPLTSYKLVCRRTTGKAKLAVTVWLRQEDGTEQYAAMGFGRSPEVAFAAPADGQFSSMRVIFHGEDYNYAFQLVLLSGTSAETGLLLADTPENFTAVTAMANRFIDRYGKKENRFVYPFLVRYALRLYDGSYVCPSAPCLMMPNVGLTPLIWTYGGQPGGTWDTFTASVVAQLRFRILHSEGLERWRGLVDGVAIAVSSPLYSYNQGVEWSKGKYMVGVERMRLDETDREDDTWSYGVFDDGDGTCSATYLFNKANTIGGTDKVYQLRLPAFDNAQLMERMKERGLFYIVKELDLMELPEVGAWTDVTMAEGTLDVLETLRTLPDDTLSLQQRGAGVVGLFNGRLMLADTSDQLFHGYRPALMNGKAGNSTNGQTERDDIRCMKAVLRTVEQGSELTACAVDLDGWSNDAPFAWFFYPGLAAKSVALWRMTAFGRCQRAVCQLRRHPLLDGAYWFDAFREPQWSDWMAVDSLQGELLKEYQLAEGAPRLRHSNRLMQSEVSNPFVFARAGVVSVGHTTITGMAAATHALSEGQFGEYPLYVFCHDGIWAMSTGADGLFNARQPVSRDKCMSPQAIIPTDRAVVFATSQGLKILRGAEVRTLSAPLDGPAADISILQGVDPDFDSLLVLTPTDFCSLLENCRLAYDYPANLLHIYIQNEGVSDGNTETSYNKASDHHYVLNLSNGEFAISCDVNSPDAIVNDYPDTILQQGSSLRRFSRLPSSAVRSAVFLTRPLSLSRTQQRKRLASLHVLWQRRSAHSSVRVALFASNDRHSWWRLSSRNSHSYRWFRIAVFARINDHERISNILISSRP